VVAKVKEHSYSAVTNEDGSFQIHVPAGHYSVGRIGSSDWVMFALDISYERPNDIEIHNGGCADFVLHALPRTHGTRSIATRKPNSTPRPASLAPIHNPSIASD
jgi:hypothetical protein